MKLIIQSLLLFRRWALQNLIPEWFWPRIIEVQDTPIKIRNTPYTFGTRWLIKTGNYEKEEIELILSIIKQEMNILEMGGSIGILTAVMANKIGPNGRIISIEASSKLTQYSKLWLEELGNVKVVNGFAFPVWDAPQIKITNFDEVTGNLGGTISFDILDRNSNISKADKIFDIKRICREFAFNPNILVIDIEGSEIIMANQPLNLPSTIQYIIIEFHDWYYSDKKNDEQKIKKSILNDGFNLIKSQSSVYLYGRKQ